MADSAVVNVVLVPALLLLVGLVFYKKIWEPRQGASKPEKVGKTQTTAKRKPEKAPKPHKNAKARAMSGSGRMGSVL